MSSTGSGLLAQADQQAQLLLQPLSARLSLTGTIGVLLLGTLVLSLAVQRVRGAYFSSLSEIPGPWHAHLTGLVLKLHILNGNRVHYVPSLHEKYGPFVRVAHNEVVTIDPVAGKEIHAVGTKWRKWSHTRDHITPNKFSIVDPKQHDNRQRFYTKVFSQTKLRQTMEPNVLRTAQAAVNGMKVDAKSNRGVMNIHKWLILFRNDVMALLTFDLALV